MSSLFVARAPSSFSQQKTKNHSSFSPPPPPYFLVFPKQLDTSLLLLDSEVTAGLATQPVPAFSVCRTENVIGDHVSLQLHPKANQDDSSYQRQECVLKPKGTELSPKVEIRLTNGHGRDQEECGCNGDSVPPSGESRLPHYKLKQGFHTGAGSPSTALRSRSLNKGSSAQVDEDKNQLLRSKLQTKSKSI